MSDDLYENYATKHAGRKMVADERLAAKRDVLPHMPMDKKADILDIGCGQGGLIRALIEAGYANTFGIDISAEQVVIAHENGVASVRCGDYRDMLVERQWGAIVATDLVEHLSRDEVVELFELVRAALGPGGRFVVRSPNATSPFGGNYQYGDYTHQTYLTANSFAQLTRHAGFSAVECFPCPPIAHGLKSSVRAAAFAVGSAAMRFMLTAETGARHHIVTQNFVGRATV